MDMREVSQQSFAPQIVKLYRDTADAICPLCGRKTFHYDFNRNVASCPACSWGGGVLDTWAMLKGISGTTTEETRKLASKDMRSGGLSRTIVNKPLPKMIEAKPLASIKKRDRINNFVLDKQGLSLEHRKSLRMRGFRDAEIDALKYRDAPIYRIHLEEDGDGVPGSYTFKNKWVFTKMKPGILLPERNSRGLIQGFQNMADDRDPKYYTISSDGKENGTKATTFVHFSNFYHIDDISKIILTEGPLKADLISIYTGLPVLSIPGVNSQKNLAVALQELKKKGLVRIIIAFDMDFYEKETVQKALRKLKKLLSDLEIEFVQRTWDSEYKGYDDYLVFKKGRA